MDIFYKLLAAVLIAVVPILAGFLCNTLVKLSKEIIERTENERTKALVEEINNAVVAAVGYVNQTFVDEMKKSGIFSSEPEYAEAAFEEAMDTVLKTISKEAQDYILHTFGDIPAYLGVKIEKSVRDYKEN